MQNKKAGRLEKLFLERYSWIDKIKQISNLNLFVYKTKTGPIFAIACKHSLMKKWKRDGKNIVFIPVKGKHKKSVLRPVIQTDNALLAKFGCSHDLRSDLTPGRKKRLEEILIKHLNIRTTDFWIDEIIKASQVMSG